MNISSKTTSSFPTIKIDYNLEIIDANLNALPILANWCCTKGSKLSNEILNKTRKRISSNVINILKSFGIENTNKRNTKQQQRSMRRFRYVRLKGDLYAAQVDGTVHFVVTLFFLHCSGCLWTSRCTSNHTLDWQNLWPARLCFKKCKQSKVR